VNIMIRQQEASINTYTRGEKCNDLSGMWRLLINGTSTCSIILNTVKQALP
jgi:hypothetical protein